MRFDHTQVSPGGMGLGISCSGIQQALVQRTFDVLPVEVTVAEICSSVRTSGEADNNPVNRVVNGKVPGT